MTAIVQPDYDQACTKANIESGFAVSDTEPFSQNRFATHDFLEVSITDRSAPVSHAREQVLLRCLIRNQ